MSETSSTTSNGAGGEAGGVQDPFRARPPQVDTEHLSSNAAELAEKAMPDNTDDEHPAAQTPTGQAAQTSSGDGEKADRPSSTDRPAGESGGQAATQGPAQHGKRRRKS